MGRIELPTSTVSIQAEDMAPSGAEPQAVVSTGHIRRGTLHQVAPNSQPSHAPGHPVGPRSRGSVRVVDGGADHLLTVRQVAERLHVHPETVRKLCTRGELAHVRISNAIRIVPSDLIAFIVRRRERSERT